MKPFPGFSPRMRFTPLPNVFFSQLLPEIDDLAELKATLHVFWALYKKRGYPRFVTYAELVGDRRVMAGMENDDALRRGLQLATARGTLIHLTLEGEGRGDDIYFLNSESSRDAVARIERGELDIGAVPRAQPYHGPKEQPNIFVLYEQNIGLLTPMIAEQLKDAEKLYPATWVEDAFKEAVSQNVRKWGYISAILERWAVEGRDRGKSGRHPEEDRDKYVKGRYGHVVKR